MAHHDPAVEAYKVPLSTAIWIVVANMIGTGVFTSLGFQLFFTEAPFVIMMLWIVGGCIALCGAFAYAELAAALPRSGGEFHFLSRIYHPAVGFVAGWLSVTVGFAVPIALSAMALSGYAMSAMGYVEAGKGTEAAGYVVLDSATFHAMDFRIGVTAVVGIAVAQLWSLRATSIFQAVFTVAKLLIIVALIVAGLTITPAPQPISFAPKAGDVWLIFSAGFASSLYWVMYSYSGWNAATYIIDEVKDPVRNLPRALLWGTVFVMALYVLLNMIFLYAAPVAALKGVKNVASPAALHIFGASGAQIVSAIICFGLIATISATTWVGPRVSKAMGEQVAALSFFAKTSKGGIPWVAVLVQMFITLAMLRLGEGNMETILNYIQFTLTVSATLTVAGLFVLRLREPDLPRPYRAWGYPITPLFFIITSVYMMVVMLQNKPVESMAGFATLLSGLVVYYGSQIWQKKKGAV
ncbi:amino acid permease [Verrucomicrobia bacterium LW23]|nr:amino acid permease [Verrucomicrobia bacterium LW23]